MTLAFYVRSVDDGQGRQNVCAVDGIISSQSLVARSGFYTGTGNPELVGKPVSVLRGRGFRKVKGPVAFQPTTGRWITLDPSATLDE